jgi:molybdopterin converting factor small subunit/tRNA threonylcarbamoyladenosine modification (KEOPS) complex Cgi121 subunit
LITIKFLGGAKKSFQTDHLEIKKINLTIDELLEYLTEIKPKDTHDFDVKNLLIAVNGIDSSALDGKMTKINDNDVVSIVPIIHGGSQKRTQLKINNHFFEVFEIRNDHFDDLFLKKLRVNYPKIISQAINFKYILNLSHLTKIVQISVHAKKTNLLLSEKIETDLLLRFAISTQISDAIKKAGIRKKQDFFIIAMGKKKDLNALYLELRPLLKKRIFSSNNSHFLRREFKITKDNIDAVLSNSPLEDILVEKAAVLF